MSLDFYLEGRFSSDPEVVDVEHRVGAQAEARVESHADGM